MPGRARHDGEGGGAATTTFVTPGLTRGPPAFGSTAQTHSLRPDRARSDLRSLSAHIYTAATQRLIRFSLTIAASMVSCISNHTSRLMP